MAKAGAIRAGRAYVELFADNSKLVRGLKQASAKLKAFGESIRNIGLKMMALGAAVAAPLLASTKVFAKVGDDLAKMSARTGFSVEALSELGFAAQLSGTNMETLETGIRKMQRTIVDAAQGTKEASDALAVLGLNVADLASLSPEEQFKLIADRLAGITDPTLKAAMAMEIFGRSGTQLLPMLANGAAGIEELQRLARDLGLTISKEDAEAAVKLRDAMSTLWAVLKRVAFTVGAALAPVLSDLAKRITWVVVNFKNWLDRNREIVVTVAKVAVGVIAAGAALVVLGTIIAGVGKVLGVLAGIAVAVATTFKVILGIFAAIVSPIGLVIVAVAALGTVILYATGAGGKALAWLGEKFRSLGAIAGGTIKGIADALMAGDISLAAKVLWAGLKLAWQDGTMEIRRVWADLWTWLKQSAAKAWYGLQIVFVEAGAAIASSLVKAAAGWQAIWATMEHGMKRTGGAISAQARRMLFASEMLKQESELRTTAREAGWTPEETEERVQDLRRRQEQARLDFEKRLIGEDTDIKTDLAKKTAAIASESAAELAKIEAEKKEALAKIVQEGSDAIADMEADNLKAREKAMQEYNEAAQAYAVALEEASEARAVAPDIDELWEKVKKLFKGLDLGELLERTTGAKGTFQAANVLGLQAGGPTDRIAKATELTAKHAKRIADQTRDGLAFGD